MGRCAQRRAGVGNEGYRLPGDRRPTQGAKLPGQDRQEDNREGEQDKEQRRLTGIERYGRVGIDGVAIDGVMVCGAQIREHMDIQNVRLPGRGMSARIRRMVQMVVKRKHHQRQKGDDKRPSDRFSEGSLSGRSAGHLA